MRRKPAETLTDFLVMAISPALIMLLVGSLVFFLMQISYDGAFPGKLRFASAMFVMATVLIARISIEEGREYASMFALPLAIVTMLSIMRYTDAGVAIVLPLVLFIWWSTDKLTWDCTVIDEKKDTSGEGLLQTVGLDGEKDRHGDSEHAAPSFVDREATTDAGHPDRRSLWQRWLEKRRRHHTPGVWVVYFGIAAIPIFGFGQWLLPPDARAAAFFLLCVYVASALALLMTTSFLQLRRYLIQRRLPLPDETAVTWFVSGAVLIVGLMAMCLLLPRPNTGYSVIDSIGRASSRDGLRASRFGWGKEGVNDPEQIGKAETSAEDAQTDDASGQQASREAEQGNRPGEQGDAEDASESRSSKSGGDRQSERESAGSSVQNEEERQGKEASDQRKQADANTRTDRQQPSSDESEAREPAGESEGSDATKKLVDEHQNVPQPAASPPNPLQHLSLGRFAKWIYVALMAILAIYVFVRYGREIGAAIRAFLRDLADLWRRLFGGAKPTTGQSEEAALPSQPRGRPFSSYQNPFTAGWASRLTPQQLVNYSFEALEAWAEEQDCGRYVQQTPLEFASQIANSDKAVGALARNLAILYNQAAYAPGSLSTEAVDHVRSLWSVLHAPAPRT